MYIFTYKDYLNYLKHKDEIEAFRKKVEEKYESKCTFKDIESDKTKEEVYCNMVCEESAEYVVSIENSNIYINNKHDKIFRKILDDKEQAAKFINEALQLKE